MQPMTQRSGFNHFLDKEFWLTLNPQLHIGGQDTPAIFEIDKNSATEFSDLLLREGYFQYHVSPNVWQLSLSALAQVIQNLILSEIKPVFAFIYDEYWLAFMRQAKLLSCILGENFQTLPAFFVFHVDPSKEESGWAPHRDRGYDNQPLLSDGRAKSLTCWIPLTNATPINGCIYIVPANLDPTYNTPNENQLQFKYQDIRALPARPGDVFFWNQSVMHWGGRSARVGNLEPRISIALEFQRGDVEPMHMPSLNPYGLPQLLNPYVLPSFEERLQLIAGQLKAYTHMYPLSPEFDEFVVDILNKSSKKV